LIGKTVSSRGMCFPPATGIREEKSSEDIIARVTRMVEQAISQARESDRPSRRIFEAARMSRLTMGGDDWGPERDSICR
jgi:hypothetical protein